MKWAVAVLLLLNASFLGWQIVYTGRQPVALGKDPGTRHREHSLRLLSEVDVTELRQRTSPVSSSSTDPEFDPRPSKRRRPAVAPSRLCYSFGPLFKDEEIAKVHAWLQRQGATATLRVNERRERTLYWVYLPPFATQVAADDMARQMRRDGINDIFVIPGGDRAHAISLGAYGQRASLERRLAQLEARGYTPSVSSQSRAQEASWFDAQFPDAFEFSEDDFAARFSSVEVERSACK